VRTEQFLEGFNSCRNCLHGLLVKYPELQKNQELLRLAQYPYYEDDGIDWHPDCEGCKNYIMNMDYDLSCKENINYKDIVGERCPKREKGG